MLMKKMPYNEKGNIIVNGVIQMSDISTVPIKANDRLSCLLSYQFNNVIFNNATPLFSYIIELTNFPLIGDVNNLRNLLLNEVNIFETRLIQKDIKRQTVEDAKYILCAMLDEVILNQQNERSTAIVASWSQCNLVSAFFPNAWGGERFFNILERNLSAEVTDMNLLELILLCLNCGFEGKYRDTPRGTEQLHTLRQRLYSLVHNCGNEIAMTHVKPTKIKKNFLTRLRSLSGFYLISSGTIIVLMFLFIGFNLQITQISDQLLGALSYGGLV